MFLFSSAIQTDGFKALKQTFTMLEMLHKIVLKYLKEEKKKKIILSYDANLQKMYVNSRTITSEVSTIQVFFKKY